MSEAILDDETPLPAPRDTTPTFAHRLEYALTLGLFALLRPLGIERASALGGAFLRTFGPLIRPISRRGEDNLRMIYADWDDTRLRRTIAGVWDNLGRTAAEFAHLQALDAGGAEARVDIQGTEILAPYIAANQPVIFVSGHFANWETMLIAIKALGMPFSFIYRPANNPLVDALIIAERARTMTRHQTPKGPRGARSLVDALKSGRSLAFLVDQKLTDGVMAPFMGRMAPTAPTAARLSLKYGAPLIYASLERLPRARFRLTVNPPLTVAPSDDLDTDIYRLTTQVNAAIEHDVRARPEQWLWLHRRWGKTLPAPLADPPQEFL